MTCLPRHLTWKGPTMAKTRRLWPLTTALPIARMRFSLAGVAELADAPDSKSGEGKIFMWVRVPPPVFHLTAVLVARVEPLVQRWVTAWGRPWERADGFPVGCEQVHVLTPAAGQEHHTAGPAARRWLGGHSE